MAAVNNTTQPLGYTPFEYWTGPKRVKPPHRNSSARPVAVDPISGLRQDRKLHGSGPRTPTNNSSHIADTKLHQRAEDDYSRSVRVPGSPADLAIIHNDIKTPDGPGHVPAVDAPPPSYAVAIQSPTTNMAYSDYDDRERSRWNICGWSKKVWIIVSVIVVIVVVIVAVAAGVVVSQNNEKNRYPDYTKLNYGLSETCKSLIFLLIPLIIRIRTRETGNFSHLTAITSRFGNHILRQI
jgi:hypothetical protein